MRLKNRKAELKQRVKVSLEKYVGMFRHYCRYNIRFIFTNIKLAIFKIPKNQSIPHSPWGCLYFSFSIEGYSNLNCLQRRVGNKI